MATNVRESIHQQIFMEVYCDSIIIMASAFRVLYSKGRNKAHVCKRDRAGVLEEI